VCSNRAFFRSEPAPGCGGDEPGNAGIGLFVEIGTAVSTAGVVFALPSFLVALAAAVRRPRGLWSWPACRSMNDHPLNGVDEHHRVCAGVTAHSVSRAGRWPDTIPCDPTGDIVEDDHALRWHRIPEKNVPALCSSKEIKK